MVVRKSLLRPCILLILAFLAIYHLDYAIVHTKNVIFPRALLQDTTVIQVEEDATSSVIKNNNTASIQERMKRTIGVSLEPTHKDWNTRIDTIRVIGERHSGTNWIYDHLAKCFGTQLRVRNRYTRWKHWFQYPDETKNTSALVVLFRHPLDWTRMNYKHPYHCSYHAKLSFHEFLTTPWTIPFFPEEAHLNRSSTEPICADHFSPNQVVPCNTQLNRTDPRARTGNPVYEHHQDGSGPYASIVDLRADKIRNFLDLRHHVPQFLPYQHEYLVEHGTDELLERLEQITGVTRNCTADPPRSLKCLRHLRGFVEWMQQHVDWNAEALVGYNSTYYSCP